MKIGIYGGTFDPIHRGHLSAAEAAARVLGLDQVLLVPDALPPHKELSSGSASGQQRYEMAELALYEARCPARVLDTELRRGGVSYTCDTLRQLKEQYPRDELWLLMGSDMFLSLHTWRQSEVITSLAGIAAFSRQQEDESLAFRRQKEYLETAYGAKVVTMVNPNLIEVSSSWLRQTLRQGGGEKFLPTPVYGYIQRTGLYGVRRDLKDLSPDELRPIALSYLKVKRMPHVLGTEREAVFLAEKYGADVEKARVAALLHDCTKKLDMQQQLALCGQYGIRLDELEQKSLKLLHSKTGAAIARDVFGVPDDVYNAIYYHTTGKPDMTLLEKVIYLADYIEPTRNFPGVERLRQAVHEDLDRGLCLALRDGVEELESMGNPVHHNTLEALSYMQTEMGG